MTKENLIKICKDLSSNNNIFFSYDDDEFIKGIYLKFRKDFKSFLWLLSDNDIKGIKNSEYFEEFLKRRLEKHNIL